MGLPEQIKVNNNKHTFWTWKTLSSQKLWEHRAVEYHALRDRVEERLRFWGDKSSLSGTAGADEVHNDAIWSSHGAMRTIVPPALSRK